ncbi:MAG: CapA family protein [Victivallales bacterium]|nr:CapA family protein [Victivallales bacterium]
MRITIPPDGRIAFNNNTTDDLRVIVTGDMTFCGYTEELLIAGQTASVFGSMLPELLDKDLSVTNLETVIASGGEPIYKCGPNIKSTPEAFAGIIPAGFDVFSLANNHTRDYGDDAFMETIQHINAAGKKYVGGGENRAQAAEPLRLDIKGIPFSLFSATMHNICEAGTNSPGANAIAPAPLAAAIALEKNAGRTVIAFIHDGKEHVPFPSVRVRENCRGFVDAGADAVICHHPHIAQGFERYGKGFIAYSLGNFLFYSLTPDTAPDFWWNGYALRLYFNNTGISGVDVIPHHLGKNSRMEVMSGGMRHEFMEKLSKLNAILADDAMCDRYYHAAVQKFVYYENNISALVKLRQAGITSGDEHFNQAFWCNHILETEEHLDALRCLTKAIATKSPVEYPDDLEYYCT